VGATSRLAPLPLHRVSPPFTLKGCFARQPFRAKFTHSPLGAPLCGWWLHRGPHHLCGWRLLYLVKRRVLQGVARATSFDNPLGRCGACSFFATSKKGRSELGGTALTTPCNTWGPLAQNEAEENPPLYLIDKGG
jgi:hypothetical protein